jgi:hypothetical protein
MTAIEDHIAVIEPRVEAVGDEVASRRRESRRINAARVQKAKNGIHDFLAETVSPQKN